MSSIFSPQVAIRNRGPEAYKPEIYGDTVYVERQIRKEGANTYTIKNSASMESIFLPTPQNFPHQLQKRSSRTRRTSSSPFWIT